MKAYDLYVVRDSQLLPRYSEKWEIYSVYDKKIEIDAFM